MNTTATSVTAQILAKCILRQMLAEHNQDRVAGQDDPESRREPQKPGSDKDTGLEDL